MAVAYDPFSLAYKDDPYPVYRALRDESRVHWSPEAEMFCVSRHEDVVAVLREPNLFSSTVMGKVLMNPTGSGFRLRMVPALLRFMWRARINPLILRRPPESLVTSDPPRHDVMRSIVNRGFTPRRIAAWEKRVGELVAQCMQKLHREEPFDLVSDLAIPLPVTVISELLGIDPARRAEFKRWSDKIIEISTGSGRDDPIGNGILDVFGEFGPYVAEIAQQRMAEPKDDLISVLVDPAHGDRLDENQIIQFVVLLLVAGNETTTNLIGNGVRALLDHPDELARVVADPALIPGTIEEVLRYDSPIQSLFRGATEDTEIAGTSIPAGSTVCVLLGAANRDERVFPEPDRFDVTRNPRGHVAFGFGVHFCLGAALARLEARAALHALIPELPTLRRRHADTPLIDSFLVRGPERLELERAA